MGPLGLDECRLFLVPATRSSNAMALLGWSAEAPLPLLCALLRSWEDRFGAQAVAVLGNELHVSVARPPAKAEHAQLLALEHVLSTAANIVDDPLGRSQSTQRASWGGLTGRFGGTSGGIRTTCANHLSGNAALRGRSLQSTTEPPAIRAELSLLRLADARSSSNPRCAE